MAVEVCVCVGVGCGCVGVWGVCVCGGVCVCVGGSLYTQECYHQMKTECKFNTGNVRCKNNITLSRL